MPGSSSAHEVEREEEEMKFSSGLEGEREREREIEREREGGARLDKKVGEHINFRVPILLLFLRKSRKSDQKPDPRKFSFS